MTVYAIGTRRTNAELIADCAALGYLRTDDPTFDATYGQGAFWKVWQPSALLAADLHNGERSHRGRWVHAWDFTHLPLSDRSFDAVVFDPPYKLNGTSTGIGASVADAAYGVDTPASWQDRHALILAGITECARVTHRMLLVKCQDQVCSGAVRWQTRILADHAEAEGFRLVDMLHVQGSRPQPAGRRQVHARRDYSTLLVLDRVAAQR